VKHIHYTDGRLVTFLRIKKSRGGIIGALWKCWKQKKESLVSCLLSFYVVVPLQKSFLYLDFLFKNICERYGIKARGVVVNIGLRSMAIHIFAYYFRHFFSFQMFFLQVTSYSSHWLIITYSDLEYVIWFKRAMLTSSHNVEMVWNGTVLNVVSLLILSVLILCANFSLTLTALW